MRLEAGQSFGDRYSLIRRIGSGGMADVWLADDAMLGRRVALKFLHERFAQDEQFVERFRREAQSAAGLQHPNVVGVYDRGEYDGRYWIAMEYVEGASLKDLITRGLSAGEAVEIVRQVLAATRFAHDNGIVHRDLKPHNVLVDAEGRARVTDFGIARAGPSEITQTGSVLGTAQYLSPEQAQGLEVGPPSDLYSIGVMLYEALTGSVPFEGDSAVAIALKQVSERPRRPSELNRGVPRALDAVVLRALAKDPANRFGSAAEFLRALDDAEQDPTAVGPGDTAAYAAAGAAPPGAPSPAAAVAHAEEEQRKRSRRNKLIALALVAVLIGAVIAYALTRPGQARVPTVIGKTQTEAERILDRAGFETFPRTFESCDVPRTVAEQDPPAGTLADDGSTVTISISLGLRVPVPDVIGLPAPKAANRLDAEDLQVKEQPVFSQKPAREVVRTEPSVGDQVECESVVTLLVSKGENLVDVPSVLGQSEEAASATLEQLGLVPNVESRDADEPEGTVIGQSPGAGSSISRGSEVQLVVSTGVGSVVVPAVEGQPEDTAINTLESRGVRNIKVVRQTQSEDPSIDGRVTDQAPSAGTRIRSGDRVTIFVSEYEEPEPPPEEPEPEPPPEEESGTIIPPPRSAGR